MHKDLFAGSTADGIHQVQSSFREKTKQRERDQPARKKSSGASRTPFSGSLQHSKCFTGCISSGTTQTLSCFYLGLLELAGASFDQGTYCMLTSCQALCLRILLWILFWFGLTKNLQYTTKIQLITNTSQILKLTLPFPICLQFHWARYNEGRKKKKVHCRSVPSSYFSLVQRQNNNGIFFSFTRENNQ